jgi:hypothetical protein
LNLKCVILVSKFASKFNLYHYNTVSIKGIDRFGKASYAVTRGGAVQLELC